ncbi:hypothetical protein B5P45_04050 [Phyllobacterium zundukense]|uniref:Uncharacterized protein n=1 Tax=Phyllobacterium zundukense TaxID=1867719 RepID=A0A2N9W309_9HYPH|nr:hypothetical protein BLM14_20200 [Phyllobacterium zundukense]PIO46127.1 hypothetical protein B5P45_04050 [Phyllobacterium zundukense]
MRIWLSGACLFSYGIIPFTGDIVWRLTISGVLADKSARYRVLSKMAVKIRQQILGALVGGGPILQLMQRL